MAAYAILYMVTNRAFNLTAHVYRGGRDVYTGSSRASRESAADRWGDPRSCPTAEQGIDRDREPAARDERRRARDGARLRERGGLCRARPRLPGLEDARHDRHGEGAARAAGDPRA